MLSHGVKLPCQFEELACDVDALFELLLILLHFQVELKEFLFGVVLRARFSLIQQRLTSGVFEAVEDLGVDLELLLV